MVRRNFGNFAQKERGIMEIKDGKPAVYCKTRKEWRKWLNENCETENYIWLILHKKNSTKECVRLIEATEEAVCFGWIDSLCKKRDEESYYLTFTPRNPKKSNWSDRNIERAERMIEQGLMTEHGLKFIEIAKEKASGKKNNRKAITIGR